MMRHLLTYLIIVDRKVFMGREKCRRKNSVLHAARTHKESERRAWRRTLWVMWLLTAGVVAATVVFTVSEHRRTGHVHVLLNLVAVDVMMCAIAVAITLVSRRST